LNWQAYSPFRLAIDKAGAPEAGRSVEVQAAVIFVMRLGVVADRPMTLTHVPEETLMTITVGQDEFVLIKQARASSDVYFTDGLADCYVFGIRFTGPGGDQAIFGHFSQMYFRGARGEQPDQSFNTMLGHLSGQTNIHIDALTNFALGMDASTKHVREALGEYGGKDITTFYLANLDKPHTGVYFFPKSCTLMADYKSYGESNVPNLKDKPDYQSPRFATHFDDSVANATKVGCCVLL